ncbi:hypothetical protein [Cellvibrio mixtus]|uniref:hypothetical protein n=1 Tax=Cellvibrio mixtus TaxID=39650 RepID=UPI0006932855|nr:hypothetical protein [Cellvibrio mixtus]
MTAIIFIPQQVQVPTVTAFQAKAALVDAGLYELVETLINDSSTPVKVRLAWQNNLDFRRDNPLLTLIAAQAGLTEEDIDNLFVIASGITAESIY